VFRKFDESGPTTMSGRISQPTWVRFLSSPDDAALQAFAKDRDKQVNFYRIRDVIPVRGNVPADLETGWTVMRIENRIPLSGREEAGLASTTPITQFLGVTEHLHYTSRDQRQELDRRSAAERDPSEQTVAVLIPIRKSAEWWALAQDQRQAYFRETTGDRGHTAIGLSYADRVFRKLYHSRYLTGEIGYDFLTYFEFTDEDVGAFRELLTALRDPERNPEWAYVELEWEIWMTKHG